MAPYIKTIKNKKKNNKSEVIKKYKKKIKVEDSLYELWVESVIHIYEKSKKEEAEYQKFLLEQKEQDIQKEQAVINYYEMMWRTDEIEEMLNNMMI